MTTWIKSTALTLAAASLALPAMPAAAADFGHRASGYHAAPAAEVQYNHRDRYDRHDRYRDRRDYGRQRAYYGEPVYANTRVWRGDDGRYYCRKKNGTTGLIVGAAGGALVGRAVDTHGERTTGTILGAALGALLGREIDRGSTRCR